MTAARMPIGPPLVASAILAIAAVGTWWWRSTVFHARAAAIIKEEPWQHVKEHYPEPKDSAQLPALSSETVEAMVHANPFDATRRLIPAAEGAAAEGGASQIAPPSAPQFVYKGLVTLGTKRRGIVEDTTIHKTYFLEVGQEVTGFKVLDIAENRVLLSHLKTNEEIVVSVSEKKSP